MISFIIISLYIAVIIALYGTPHSLSATYYSLNYKFTFSLILILAVAFSFNEFMTPEKWQFLPFLFLSGILFVGFAPDFRSDNLTDRVHTGAAIISLIASQIWVGIVNPFALILWSVILIYFLIKYKEQKSIKKVFENTNIKFWSEIVMLLTTFSSVAR